MPPKDVERMANSVDPDQTALTDQNLHCLRRHTCPNIQNFYGNQKLWYKSLPPSISRGLNSAGMVVHLLL